MKGRILNTLVHEQKLYRVATEACFLAGQNKCSLKHDQGLSIYTNYTEPKKKLSRDLNGTISTVAFIKFLFVFVIAQ